MPNRALLRSALIPALVTSFALSSPDATRAATPDDNDHLSDEISFLIGALDAAVVVGLLPLPFVGNYGEFVEYSTNLGLKALAPAFLPPPNRTVETNNDNECTYAFSVPRSEDSFEDWFGFWTIDSLASNWGDLSEEGSPQVFHANSTVRVRVDGPGLTTKEDERDEKQEANLSVGLHRYQWKATTQLSPVLDIIVPPVLAATGALVEAKYGDAIGAKIAKKSPKVAKALKKKSIKLVLNIAKAAGVQAANYAADQLLKDEVGTSSNSAVQEFRVLDAHTPFVRNSGAPEDPFEATDLGGTRFIRIEEELLNRVEYGDYCGRPTRLRHNAPNILPLGTSQITWTALDGDGYEPGVDDTSSYTQTVSVEDTQPPILVAPMGFVREVAEGQSSFPLDEEELGLPLVIDLADPAPTISNDAPGSIPVDSRVAISWTAEDASFNFDSKLQWVTAKSPGSNTPPSVANHSTAASTAETVDIRLDGVDLDLLEVSHSGQTFGMVDQLEFEIVDHPEHGEFVAPLRPFFIEDFRLTPVGETEQKGVRTSPLGELAEDFAGTPPNNHYSWVQTNFCDQDKTMPFDMVYRPTYVHVTDGGTYFVRDAFWDCEDPTFGDLRLVERISKWSEDREFLGHYRLSDADNFLGIPRDVFTIDRDGVIWWVGDEPSFGGAQFTIHSIDDKLEYLSGQQFVVSEEDFIGLRRGLSYAHGDSRRNLMYVHDRRGIMIYRLEDRAFLGRLSIDGEELFLPGPNGLFDPGPPPEECPRTIRTWMTTDSRGDLYISDGCRDRILKFAASQIDRDGELVPGEFLGWMGSCTANVAPWSGCDEDSQTSRGYSCTDQICLRAEDTTGEGPGQFSGAGHINIDPNDQLYVADEGNLRVQRFGPDGSFSGQANSEGTGINQGEAPGFVLGNMGPPSAVSVNSTSFYVMEFDQTLGDFFLHIFKSLPFWSIEYEGETHPNDVDDDGYEDNATIVKYRSQFNFPGHLGFNSAEDSFTYRVSDGLADSNLGTVTVEVSRSYRAPEEAAIRCYAPEAPETRISCEVDEDSAMDIELIAKDPDGIVGFDGLDILSYALTLQPEHGELSLRSANAGSITYRYTPDPDYNGSDQLAYSVSDGIDNLESEAFAITVLPVDDDPVFELTHASALRGFPASVQIRVTDVDRDPDEELPHDIEFIWGNGSSEQKGELVQIGEDEYEATGPLLTQIRPGEHEAMGNPTYTANGNYQLELDWAYDPEDEQHAGNAGAVVLGNIEVVEEVYLSGLMTTSDAEPAPGQLVTLNTVVTNHEPQGWPGLDSVDTQVTMEIPAGLALGTLSPLCQEDGSSQRLRCDLGTLMPGAEINFPVNVRVDESALPRPFLPVTAKVRHRDTPADLPVITGIPLYVIWPDLDADELPDDWETAFGLDTGSDDSALDFDDDGLDNLEEFAEGTHPRLADSDGDGLSDGREVNELLSDPLDADSDDDGEDDGAEYAALFDFTAIEGGRTSALLDLTALDTAGAVVVDYSLDVAAPGALGPESVAFEINPRASADPGETSSLLYDPSDFEGSFEGAVGHRGLILLEDDGELGDFTLRFDEGRSGGGRSGFYLDSTSGIEGPAFDIAEAPELLAKAGSLRLAGNLLLSDELASELGSPGASGQDVGDVLVEAVPEPTGLALALAATVTLATLRRRRSLGERV